MTVVRATCPECGDVEFGIGQIVVTGTSTLPIGFRFSCLCGCHVEGHADSETLQLLMDAGARVLGRHSHRRMHPAGSARSFTEQDVDSLRETLDRPDWFQELLDCS